MADEHNVFDLSELLATPAIHEFDTPDISGKPAPVNVRVQLNSGVVVKCDCRYQGINPRDGDRIFTVIAEIDWENYQPKLIIVEEMPDDVELRLRVAGLPDELDSQYCNGLALVPERIVHVR